MRHRNGIELTKKWVSDLIIAGGIIAIGAKRRQWTAVQSMPLCEAQRLPVELENFRPREIAVQLVAS